MWRRGCELKNGSDDHAGCCREEDSAAHTKIDPRNLHVVWKKTLAHMSMLHSPLGPLLMSSSDDDDDDDPHHHCSLTNTNRLGARGINTCHFAPLDFFLHTTPHNALSCLKLAASCVHDCVDLVMRDLGTKTSGKNMRCVGWWRVWTKTTTPLSMSGEGRTGWTKKTLSDVQWWSVWAGLHGFDDRRAAESFATLLFF
jgi:hypothetical protein